MKKLEMIKVFAGLNGDNIRVDEVCGYAWLHSTGETYNPITDLALNCAARDKYYVEVDYKSQSVYIFKSLTQVHASYYKECDLCKAVIHCILKSEGLWK